MIDAVLPPALARGATILVLTIAALVLAMHTLLLDMAAQRASLGARARSRAPALAAAFLAVWFGTAMVVADQTNFPLAHAEWMLPLGIVMMLAPIAVAVGALLGSTTLRTINAAMPPSWLIRLQTYRVAGLIFLFPFLAYHAVPASFAVTATVGDVITGIFAAPVAAMVDGRGPAAYGWARLWNAFGILDLVVVPATAVLSGAPVFTHYPLGIIALFIGPPIGIATHLYSLRNLAAREPKAARSHESSLAGVQHA